MFRKKLLPAASRVESSSFTFCKACKVFTSVMFSPFSVLLFVSVRGRKSSEERHGWSVRSHRLRPQYVRTASVQQPSDDPARHALASFPQGCWWRPTAKWIRARLRHRQLRLASSQRVLSYKCPKLHNDRMESPNCCLMLFLLIPLVVPAQWDRAPRCLCCRTKMAVTAVSETCPVGCTP